MRVARYWTAAVVSVCLLGGSPSVSRAHEGDRDEDGIADSLDNCPAVANPSQSNSDGIPAGDACQCGDVDGNGLTNTVDALMIARGEVNGSNPEDKCDVSGDALCNTVDALMIARGEVGPDEMVCASFVGTCTSESFPSTFDAIQHRIFDNPVYGPCNNTICHSTAFEVASGGLNLTEGLAYPDLVNVNAVADPTFRRVHPGDHELSYLWRKVANRTFAGNCSPDDCSINLTPMPFAGAALTVEHVEALRLWIRGGAPQDGVVDGTAELLDACLPPPTPITIVAPDPPPAGEGVQFHMPVYEIEPFSEGTGGEREVCYATYFDYRRRCQAGASVGELCNPATAPVGCDCRSAQVPEASIDPSGNWLFYRDYELTQNANSHHSINRVYNPLTGQAQVDNPVWGTWTCKGGDAAGQPCNPRSPTNCPDSCATNVVDAIACIGYGPSDLDTNAYTYSGAQQPFSSANWPAGVFSRIPMEGILVWNSHAFNLTDDIQPMEGWVNVYFAPPAERDFQVQGIFDTTQIWKIGSIPIFNPGGCNWVPAFQRGQACHTYTIPRYARLFELSSHYHKRGALFEIFDPSGARIYASTVYNDPVVLVFDPPVALDSALDADRTYRYCATWDNGFTDPADVKRASTTPPNAIPPVCTPTHCAEGRVGEPCTTDAGCDTTTGAGNGACDACPLWGGVSTEDEMFILLGSYYVDPP
jgi:hypothetical protein